MKAVKADEVFTKNVLNVAETAYLLDITKGWLYKLVEHGDIPHYKRGKRVFFEREEVEKWQKGVYVPTRKEMLQRAISINAKGGKL